MLQFDNIDLAYQALLQHILDNGVVKENRTGVPTLSTFGYAFKVDISKTFPLLTVKKMSGGMWTSIVEELLWYLSGEHHIRNLSKKTKIWNQWADENQNLSFAYGRFWRRFPVPEIEEGLPGEAWVTGNRDAMKNFILEEERMIRRGGQDWKKIQLVFDQIAYILHTLKTAPASRRMALTAWHPANAAVANPPACHTLAVFNVSPNEKGEMKVLNCHLTMRSNDVGLGAPFNWAQYSMLTYLLAKAVGMTPGYFAYSGVDCHLYLGEGENAKYNQRAYAEEILTRNPLPGPTLKISHGEIDALIASDFKLEGYQHHDRITMACVP